MCIDSQIYTFLSVASTLNRHARLSRSACQFPSVRVYMSVNRPAPRCVAGARLAWGKKGAGCAFTLLQYVRYVRCSSQRYVYISYHRRRFSRRYVPIPKCRADVMMVIKLFLPIYRKVQYSTSKYCVNKSYIFQPGLKEYMQ